MFTRRTIGLRRLPVASRINHFRIGVRTSPSGKRLSVLLTSAASGGTIAAVRHLGARGLDVRVVSSQRLAAAARSRRAAGSYSDPPETESNCFLDRLLAIGKADPGRILLPTSARRQKTPHA